LCIRPSQPLDGSALNGPNCRDKKFGFGEGNSLDGPAFNGDGSGDFKSCFDLGDKAQSKRGLFDCPNHA